MCFSKKNKKNKKNGVEDIDGAAASVGGAEGAAAQVGGAEMVPAQGNMDLVKLKKALDEMTKVSLLSTFFPKVHIRGVGAKFTRCAAVHSLCEP